MILIITLSSPSFPRGDNSIFTLSRSAAESWNCETKLLAVKRFCSSGLIFKDLILHGKLS